MAEGRKRANVSADTGGFDLMATLKKFWFPIAVVLIWGGASYFTWQNASEPEDCPDHWHAMFEMNINGQRVTANADYNPAWGDAGSSGQNVEAAGFHIHDATGTLHVHPGVQRCVWMEDILAHLNVDLDNDALVLEAPDQPGVPATSGWVVMGVAGTYAVNETHTVKVFRERWEGEFQEIDADDLHGRYQFRNGDRYFVYYGLNNETAIESQLAGAQALSNQYAPPDPDTTGAFIKIVAFGFLAIVALVVWNKFRLSS